MPTIHHHELEHRSLAYSWSHGSHPHPLIVLHGLGDSAIHTYAPRFASTALQSTPALFIDLPGFGEGSASGDYSATIEAMAEDVASLILNLGVTTSPIFAHSMGANVAISLSTDFPEVAKQLILAEPLLLPEDSVLAAGIAKQSEDAFVAGGYKMLVRATSLQARRGSEAASAFLPPLQMANPTSLHRAATSLLRNRDPSFEAMLYEHLAPVSVLFGEHSDADFSAISKRNIPTTCVPDTGHFMMAEAATATACAILKIVNGMYHGGI